MIGDFFPIHSSVPFYSIETAVLCCFSPWTSEELEEVEQLHRGDEAQALGVGRHVAEHREEAVVQGAQPVRPGHQELVHRQDQEVQVGACFCFFGRCLCRKRNVTKTQQTTWSYNTGSVSLSSTKFGASGTPLTTSKQNVVTPAAHGGER